MIAKSDWELLDIEPTNDIRQIKKAYASKLKLYSPEDNPEQFQKLRQVFERVLQYAKQVDLDRFVVDTFEAEVSIDNDVTFYNTNAKEPKVANIGYVNTRSADNKLIEPEMEEQIDVIPTYKKIMHQINNLYDNYNCRLDLNKWEEIFKDEVLWDVETYRILKTWFFDFLYAGHFVPNEVLRSYNKYFLWELNSEEYHQKYDDVFLTYIRESIEGIFVVPGYEYLMQGDCEDIEKYINYREYGFAYFLSGDLKNAYQNLNNTLDMLPDDPYVFCLLGAYYDATDKANGNKYVKLGAKLSTDPWRIYLFGGQLLHRLRKYKKALRYYNKIPKSSCYFITAQSAIINCLCSMEKYHKCGFLLRCKQKKYREDAEFKNIIIYYYDTILELKKRFPNSLILWYESRIIFPYVRNHGEENPHKYTSNYIIPSLKLVGKAILAFLLLIIVLATRGAIVIPLIFVYRMAKYSASLRE